MIRLQKALADRGVASRRRAEELIAGGRVRVDGVPVTTLGTKVAADARIDVDGVPAPAASAAPRYVALNKPRGVVSTAHDERGRRTVVDLIGARERLYPVGRLDTDSEGLLLLTNDGEWSQRVLHPRYGHEREYEVSVSGELEPAAIARLQSGIRLDEGIAVATRVEVVRRSRRESQLRIVLHTGWRRQVRRMLSFVGLKTVRLVRVRIGSLALGKLRTGEWRELTSKEVADLARPVERLAPRPLPSAQRRTPTAAAGVRPSAPRARSSAPRARPVAARARPVVSRSGPAASRPRPAPPSRGIAPLRRRPGLVPGRRPRPYGASRGPVRARVAPR